jgi:hypothetical protein
MGSWTAAVPAYPRDTDWGRHYRYMSTILLQASFNVRTSDILAPSLDAAWPPKHKSYLLSSDVQLVLDGGDDLSAVKGQWTSKHAEASG